jgi:hypothetical protein
MQSEYRRFVITGSPEQQKALEELVSTKKLSREDITLILHTMAFRDPSFDTLSK